MYSTVTRRRKTFRVSEYTAVLLMITGHNNSSECPDMLCLLLRRLRSISFKGIARSLSLCCCKGSVRHHARIMKLSGLSPRDPRLRHWRTWNLGESFEGPLGPLMDVF